MLVSTSPIIPASNSNNQSLCALTQASATGNYTFKNCDAGYLMPYCKESGSQWPDLPHVIQFLDYVQRIYLQEGLLDTPGPDQRQASTVGEVNLKLIERLWPAASVDESIQLMHCQHDDDSAVVTTSEPVYRGCVAVQLWPVHYSDALGERTAVPLGTDSLFEDNEMMSFWQPLSLDFLWVFVRPASVASKTLFYKVVGKPKIADGQTLFLMTWPYVEQHDMAHWHGDSKL